MYFCDDEERVRLTESFSRFARTEVRAAGIDACDQSIVNEAKILFKDLADLTFFVPLLDVTSLEGSRSNHAIRSRFFIAVLRYVELLNRVDALHGRPVVVGPLCGQFAVVAFRALIAELQREAATGAHHVALLEQLLRRLHSESWRRSLGAS